MRLHLVSDLHLDHDLPVDDAWLAGLKAQPDVDLLVVAGDWYSVYRPAHTASMVQRLLELYQRVLLVPGNHDFWQTSPHTVVQHLNLLTYKQENRVFVAPEPRRLEIAGKKFLCGTMWYRKPADRSGGRLYTDFIDFRRIMAPPEWVFEQQQAFYDLFYEGPALDDTVVVTHHLPSPRSTPEKFRGSATNKFFVCDMSGPILERRPQLWLHGHTHDPFDYTIYKTRVVCHPRGYPFEYRTRPAYEPKLVEVP